MVRSRKISTRERGALYTLVTSVIMVLYLFSSKALAQDLIRQGDTLGLNECTGIALKSHPGIAGAAGSLKASSSRTHEARSTYYPQVSAKSSYTREHPLAVSGREEATANQFSNILEVSQTLLDFGRTSALVEARSFNEESYHMDLQDVTREIIFNVKKAYFGVLQAKQSRDAYGEEVGQLKLHLDQARRFHEVGLKAKIDVTNAEVNLGQARLNLLNAENGLRLARLGLNNAMGVPDAPSYDIKEDSGMQDYVLDLESALKKGYERRPDLISARSKREAAERSVFLARRDYYPTLTGNAGYGWSGREYPLDEEWSVGATLNFPIFSGFNTRYRVEEALADLETAKANEELVRQGVRLEVEQSYTELQSIRERISLAELTLRQAKENRDLAQGRYASGVGSTIEVADAVVLEVNARTALINAKYDYRIAVAGLENAMGGRE